MGVHLLPRRVHLREDEQRSGEQHYGELGRPEPIARTYDLDATVGRRTLVSDDGVTAGLWTGHGPVVIVSFTGGGG